MASNSENFPATDSAAELRAVIGTDSTANFEDDPTFVDSNPTSSASSQHLAGDADVDETDEDDEELEDDDTEDDDDEVEDDELEDDDEDDVDDADDVDDDEELEDDDDDEDEVDAEPAV